MCRLVFGFMCTLIFFPSLIQCAKISDFMRTCYKKQSESVHKTEDALTNLCTKTGPLYLQIGDMTVKIASVMK